MAGIGLPWQQSVWARRVHGAGGQQVHYHVIATLSGGRRKSVYNKTDEQVLALVVQFLKNGTISATWGSKSQTY